MKKIIFFIALSLTALFIPCRAFGWGVATHAYFAEELGKKYGVHDLEMMVYGAVAPDMFNLEFDLPHNDYLHDQTHYNFMKVSDNAVGIRQQAFAAGFTSHNDSCGADYTAHHNGRTTPGKGYIITKVEMLTPVLIDQVLPIVIDVVKLPSLAQTLADSIAPSLTELFIETAVDLLIKRHKNQSIGTLMFQSAQFTDLEIDSLLVTAYAKDYAAVSDTSSVEAGEIITGIELEYRALIREHGETLIKPEDEVIPLLAEKAAEITEAYIKNKTGGIFDFTIPPEIITVYKNFLLDYAIPEVEEDYSAEIAATLAYLEEQYIPVPVEDTPAASAYILCQNYPNPFNSSTMIEYYIPKQSLVKIEVYNVLGQRIAVLADAVKQSGSHSVIWNAAGMASGLYFCRIEAGIYTAVRKMELVR